MTEEHDAQVKEETDHMRLSDFLESNPPNQVVAISDMGGRKSAQYGDYSKLKTPELQLHCDNEMCNGTRFFRCVRGENSRINSKSYTFLYITYRCSNCQESEKTFSIAAKIDVELKEAGHCYKMGELPTFGPPVSSRLIKLIGPDRDEFLKGRKCENLGLGVGAFIYYRRVVENQKNRILEQIIKVSNKLNATPEDLGLLEKALAEPRFAKALDMAKPAIPESLLINGHNPLALLHGALSDGVHNMKDEECLTIAGSGRVVLGELSERLSQALKDEAELKKALGNLMRRGPKG